jgi:citronellyl-CoA dehydrogenase
MLLHEEHDAFRAMVRRFVEELNPLVAEWEAAEMMPLHDIFTRCASLGILGLEYDEAVGGQGADHVFTMILAEEFGRLDHAALGMALGVQVAMATPSLAHYGTPEQIEQWLRPALTGQYVASIAVSEPDAGSDVASLRTRAVRDGDEWVINGTKTWITNSLQADWLCLLARTSEDGESFGTGYAGMSQIIVPTNTPGFTATKIANKLGMKASDTGTLTFDNCRVPVANTIGVIGRGFQQQMAQFVVERMWGAYCVIGACDRALERTRDYCRERSVFGKPLTGHQYVSFKLAELAAQVDLLRHYHRSIVEQYQAGGDVTRMATIAKLTAGRLVREVGDWCLQFHGGMGYVEENWPARFVRDNRLTSIGGGADEVMLQVLAKLDGLSA